MVRKPDLKKIAELVKSRETIIISTRFIKTLGFDDIRDFFESVHDFGYTTDFTYNDAQTTDFYHFMRRYLKDTFLD